VCKGDDLRKSKLRPAGPYRKKLIRNVPKVDKETGAQGVSGVVLGTLDTIADTPNSRVRDRSQSVVFGLRLRRKCGRRNSQNDRAQTGRGGKEGENRTLRNGGKEAKRKSARTSRRFREVVQG